MILIIDTSGSFCSVALCDENGTIIDSKTETLQNTHAEKLPVMTSEILKFSGVQVKDLSAVAVAKGPGSYTGLRIGTSLAKGMCYAANLPLMSLNSYLGMAVHAAKTRIAELYFSHLDARRNEIYLEIYDANFAVIKKMHACILDDQSFKEYADRSILFCGNSNIKIKEICAGLRQVVFVDSFPEAAFLAKEASEKWKIKDFEDLAYFEPSYLKDFIPGKPKKFLL